MNPKAEGCEARSNLRGTKQSARHEAICEARSNLNYELKSKILINSLLITHYSLLNHHQPIDFFSQS